MTAEFVKKLFQAKYALEQCYVEAGAVDVASSGDLVVLRDQDTWFAFLQGTVKERIDQLSEEAFRSFRSPGKRKRKSEGVARSAVV